jgi:hypothetical protein
MGVGRKFTLALDSRKNGHKKENEHLKVSTNWSLPRLYSCAILRLLLWVGKIGEQKLNLAKTHMCWWSGSKARVPPKSQQQASFTWDAQSADISVRFVSKKRMIKLVVCALTFCKQPKGNIDDSVYREKITKVADKWVYRIYQKIYQFSVLFLDFLKKNSVCIL